MRQLTGSEANEPPKTENEPLLASGLATTLLTRWVRYARYPDRRHLRSCEPSRRDASTTRPPRSSASDVVLLS